MRRADLPRKAGALLAVSQSGETKDVHRAVKLGEEAGIPCISVVNVVGSLIARSTGLGVYLNAGRENAVASTKAFTSQVTVLSLLALWFRQLREDRDKLTEPALKRELLDALQRLPISFGMALRTRDQCKSVAAELADKNNLFVLGKGYGEPIAMEGALKIKEMSYVHAEGYSGGALKHGPFALIEGKEGREGQTPVIVLILDDDHAAHMRTSAEEVQRRIALQTLCGTDCGLFTPPLHFTVLLCPGQGPRRARVRDHRQPPAGARHRRPPDRDPLQRPPHRAHRRAAAAGKPRTSLVGCANFHSRWHFPGCSVSQLIAYELAVLKGLNPDVPRNLAKAVTTD